MIPIASTIDKLVLDSLPIESYVGRIVVIDTPEKAQSAIRTLSKSRMVGFDTETKPSFKKGQRHKIALLQISTLRTAYLFRLNLIGFPKELKHFISREDITKIGLSVHDDFGAIHQRCEVKPQGFIDLQKIVREYGIEDMSLQKIYALLFGKKISKSQRLSNWESPTLSPMQQSYAALDALAPLRIYRRLMIMKDKGIVAHKQSENREDCYDTFEEE